MSKAKGKASLGALQELQSAKKALVAHKVNRRKAGASKEELAKIQSEIDRIVVARNVMAGELKATMKETSLWAMGGNSAKGQLPIGVCALYR